jgi:hypothetical protein
VETTTTNIPQCWKDVQDCMDGGGQGAWTGTQPPASPRMIMIILHHQATCGATLAAWSFQLACGHCHVQACAGTDGERPWHACTKRI